MNPTELDGRLAHARRVFGFMAAGVIPSADNARLAHEAAQDASEALALRGEAPALDTARQLATFIASGIAPRQELCQQAMQELHAVRMQLRELDSDDAGEPYADVPRMR